MACRGSQIISLKVLIDKKNNKVVMAETDTDFVDILLSFLTIPMGSIVRLSSKQPQPAVIGCFTTLYKEVENLKEEFLQNLECKSRLLCPKNPHEIDCSKLKLNIDDDTEPTRYYICSDWKCTRRVSGGLYTTSENVICSCCKVMNKEIFMMEQAEAATGNEGVFVCGMTKFLVTDDLEIKPMSPTTIFKLLRKHGMKDMSSLQESTLSIGSGEILNLLKGSLLSKTPLTDVLLKKQGFTSTGDLAFEIGESVHFPNKSPFFISPVNRTMKLTMRKSTNKVIYAEAGKDMVDFLLSFLTLPLGTILQLIGGGDSSLGTINNLYKSVEFSKLTKNDSVRDLLLYPGLCPGSYNPLGVNRTVDRVWCSSYENPSDEDGGPYTGYLTTKGPIFCDGESYSPLSFASETANEGGGFVKGQATFIVTDDLSIAPVVSMWSISLLRSTQCPLNDLEVHTVKVGKDQALKLLKASFHSKSVLTTVFRRPNPQEVPSKKRKDSWGKW